MRLGLVGGCGGFGLLEQSGHFCLLLLHLLALFLFLLAADAFLFAADGFLGLAAFQFLGASGGFFGRRFCDSFQFLPLAGQEGEYAFHIGLHLEVILFAELRNQSFEHLPADSRGLCAVHLCRDAHAGVEGRCVVVGQVQGDGAYLPFLLLEILEGNVLVEHSQLVVPLREVPVERLAVIGLHVPEVGCACQFAALALFFGPAAFLGLALLPGGIGVAVVLQLIGYAAFLRGVHFVLQCGEDGAYLVEQLGDGTALLVHLLHGVAALADVGVRLLVEFVVHAFGLYGVQQGLARGEAPVVALLVVTPCLRGL